MTARAAIRTPRRFLPRTGSRREVIRAGRAAAFLPTRLVAALSGAAFAVAAFSLGFTAATHDSARMAETDSPAVTGSVKAN